MGASKPESLNKCQGALAFTCPIKQDSVFRQFGQGCLLRVSYPAHWIDLHGDSHNCNHTIICKKNSLFTDCCFFRCRDCLSQLPLCVRYPVQSVAHSRYSVPAKINGGENVTILICKYRWSVLSTIIQRFSWVQESFFFFNWLWHFCTTNSVSNQELFSIQTASTASHIQCVR